jgi:hypothetical protein
LSRFPARGDLQIAAGSGTGRSISMAVCTALVPNRFRDFWRERPGRQSSPISNLRGDSRRQGRWNVIRPALWPWRSEESVPQSMVTVRPSGFVEPCIPTRAAKPPASPGWVHEIKHDGYRLQVHRHGAAVRLFTRRGYDWSERYPAIASTASSCARRDILRASEKAKAADGLRSSVNARRGVGGPVPPTCWPYRGSEP